MDRIFWTAVCAMTLLGPSAADAQIVDGELGSASKMLGFGEPLAPPDVSSYPVRGIDISHHQGDIDWKLVGQAGLSFVYMKATEGDDFVDDHLRANWIGAARAGLARGAYHFYNFRERGLSQAENFVSQVPSDPGALPPMLDLEVSNCAVALLEALPDTATFHRDLSDFAGRIEQVYGQDPVLYVEGCIYRKYFAGGDFPFKFWIVDIWHPAPGFPDSRPWTFWQYGWHGRVPGIPTEVDLDAFAGGLEDLRRLERPEAGPFAQLP